MTEKIKSHTFPPPDAIISQLKAGGAGPLIDCDLIMDAGCAGGLNRDDEITVSGNGTRARTARPARPLGRAVVWPDLLRPDNGSPAGVPENAKHFWGGAGQDAEPGSPEPRSGSGVAKRGGNSGNPLELAPALTPRQARQAFWTSLMNDEAQKPSERLKASELLAKSEGDFLESRRLGGDTDQPLVVKLVED